MQPVPATGAAKETAPAKKRRGRPRHSERGSAEAGAKDPMGVGSKGSGEKGGDKGEGASAGGERSGRASGGGGGGGGAKERGDGGGGGAPPRHYREGGKAARRGGGGGNPAPRPYGAGKGQSNCSDSILFSLYSIEFLFVAN